MDIRTRTVTGQVSFTTPWGKRMSRKYTVIPGGSCMFESLKLAAGMDTGYYSELRNVEVELLDMDF